MPFVFLAIFIIMIILAFVLMPKPQTQKPPTAGTVDVPTAEPGREIPVLFGTRDITSPMVAWYGDIKTKAIKSKSGGKK